MLLWAHRAGAGCMTHCSCKSKNGNHLRCSAICRNLAAGSVTQQGSCGRVPQRRWLFVQPIAASSRGQWDAPLPAHDQEKKGRKRLGGLFELASFCISCTKQLLTQAAANLHHPPTLLRRPSDPPSPTNLGAPSIVPTAFLFFSPSRFAAVLFF